MARKSRRTGFAPRLELFERRTLLSLAGYDGGTNLDGNNYYQNADMWVDVAKTFQPWASATSATLQLSAQGYPLSNANTYALLQDTPDGVYNLSYRGTATATAVGLGTFTTPPVKGADGVTRGQITVNHGNGGGNLYFSFINVNPADPPHDLHLTEPGYAPGTTQVFTNDYLHRLQPFTTLRFMDLLGTNVNTQVNWSDRVLPDNFLQGGSNGIAYEYVADLANATGKDVWINIPAMATPDFVRNLADLLRDDVTTGASVYVEYGNETWNSYTPLYQQVQTQANSNPLITTTDGYYRAAQEEATKIVQFGTIFRQEFGARASQVKPVYGGQQGGAYFSQIGLGFMSQNYGAPSQYLSGVAIGDYLGASGDTLDALFASLQTNVGPNGYVLQEHQQNLSVVAPYGLPLYAYEGGVGITAYNSNTPGLVAQSITDPRMGPILTQLARDWAQLGGGVNNHYTFIAPYGSTNYYGLLDGITLPGSPQWDAEMSVLLPAGDATLDGKVDANDFAVLADHFDQPGAQWWEQGDFNGDNTVNEADLEILRGSLSNVTPAQAEQVALFNAPAAGVAGTGLTFDAGGAARNGLSYLWTATAAGATVATGTGAAFSYTPTAAGNEVVTLSVAAPGAAPYTGSVPVTVAAGGGAAGLAAPAAQDGGFETPMVSPGGYAYDAAGGPWVFTGPAGVTANGSGFTNGNPAAPDGAQAAFLQYNGTASQLVPGFQAAGTYVVNFQAAQRGNNGTSRQDFAVVVDGTQVSTFTPPSTSYGSYTSAPFTVPAGSHTVGFVGLDTAGGDNTAFIDSVAVAQAPATPAPAVQDGGFEAPALAAGAYQGAPGGTRWTYAGSAGVASNGSAFTSGNPGAPEGTQVAFLYSTGSLTQAVPNWSAGTYVIDFRAAQRGNYQAARQDFAVTVDGRTVSTFTPSSTSYGSYATAAFSVTAGSHTVGFVGLDTAGGDDTAFIDSVAVAQAPAAGAPAVQDGGFEAPSVGAGGYNDFAYAPAGTPWSYAGQAGVAGNGSGFTAGNPGAPEGTQVAFVETTGSLTQAVPNWSAGTYVIDFRAAQRGNYQAARQDFAVTVDGRTVSTFTPGSASYGTYATAAFSVTAGSHTIGFAGLDSAGGDNTAFLDDVKVVTS